MLIVFIKYPEPGKVKTRLAKSIGMDNAVNLHLAFVPIIIGSDSPLFEMSVIKQAFLALDKVDCVLGPSSDREYYLLGLKNLVSELFDLKKWSTNVIFERTKKIVINLNMKLKVMEEYFDIDEKEDLIMLEKKLEYTEYSCDCDLSNLREQISKIIKIS